MIKNLQWAVSKPYIRISDKYYTCGMDNFFISEKFLRVAYAETKSKIMVHGVFRQKVHGLPKFFVQEDYTKIEEKLML